MREKENRTVYTGRFLRRRRRRRWLSSLALLILPVAAAGLLYTACSARADAAAHPEDGTLPVFTQPSAASTQPPATTEPDYVPPVIGGVRDLEFYVGDTAAYRADVTVTDDRDPEPVLEVNSSAVDLSQPGEYTLIYIAVDKSGNASWAEAKVTVKEKPENWVDPQEIYALADAILDSILTEDMTVEDQVRAIYLYVNDSITYRGHSDREDYVQTAYRTMRSGEGDCFGYFAVSKLMLERMEIPNIDVRKVKNHDGDSDHFWSLVSVDGGTSYYHFDATPRKGQTEPFCLVTDEFLDAYSEEHKNSHNRDKSLYPETPEA